MENPGKMNTTALAFLGDAVYEVHVRERVLSSGEVHADMLHRFAVRYVKAASQAKVYRKILPELTEDEAALSKRARNHKMHTMAKNADPVDYKNATAFEALLGYIYLKGDTERLMHIITRAFEIVEGKDE
ncbi:MAG: ribonuclease III [Clostridia bacterium]|nr:ribonuclease III [Clostridia bacterium]